MDFALDMGCRSSERHETIMDAHTYWTATAMTAMTVAERLKQQEDERDEDEYSKNYKFGGCDQCGNGLGDESEFILTESKDGETRIVCVDCCLHIHPWL
jgi:hypothetical protein